MALYALFCSSRPPCHFSSPDPTTAMRECLVFATILRRSVPRLTRYRPLILPSMLPLAPRRASSELGAPNSLPRVPLIRVQRRPQQGSRSKRVCHLLQDRYRDHRDRRELFLLRRPPGETRPPDRCLGFRCRCHGGNDAVRGGHRNVPLRYWRRRLHARS